MSDWKTASIAALGLLGIAAFIVFETHLGFERQIGILFALLPGAFLAATLGRHLAGTKHIFFARNVAFYIFPQLSLVFRSQLYRDQVVSHGVSRH
jgi:hypothetical protein